MVQKSGKRLVQFRGHGQKLQPAVDKFNPTIRAIGQI
jgi:hypothetical protein